MKSVLLILLFFVFQQAHAIVDMRNANFSDTWTDIIVPGSGYDLKVVRPYNSRSLFNGMFGFGWCSEFETKLEVTADSNIRVTECGSGLEVEYLSKNYDANSGEKTVKSIMAEVKKRNPGKPDRYFKDIEGDIRKNYVMREAFIKEFKLQGRIQVGQNYYANGRENETVTLKDGVYTRTLADGTSQKFDTEGRLTHRYDKNGNYLKLVYSNNRLTEINDNNGRKLLVKYNDQNGKVKEILGPNGLKASYTYKDEDLISATNAWKHTFQYKYDTLHNLTRITFPDKTFKELTYDENRDWVLTFKNRKGCVETYKYEIDKKDPQGHYVSRVQKKCNEKITNVSSYEFFYKTNKNGSRYLHRVLTNNNGSVNDVVYHDVFGKPTAVRRNNFLTTYKYYPTGLMQEKSDPTRQIAFNYENSCKKVSKVVAKYFEVKNNPSSKDRVPTQSRKLAKTVTTQFEYDNVKCNLVFAKNTDGQQIKLSYDQRGRIAMILDHAKKEVHIKYEERFGKPLQVTRPGLGTITVKYSNDGQIEKVDSPDGPIVASQVAGIFNNLLEIIAPATSDTTI